MASLIEIASRARDLYNQDYPDRVEFFDMDDFKFQIAANYSTILNGLFQAARVDSKKEQEFSCVEISPSWLITQTVTTEQVTQDKTSGYWTSKTDFPIFSFDFDAFGNGLNSIRIPGKKCQVVKISNLEAPFYDIIPTTPDVYYFVEGKNTINYLKAPPTPLIKSYIPAFVGSDDNCQISDSVVPMLIRSTLELMFGARSGTIVPEANDGNSNEEKGQQVNPSLNKVQAQG